MKIVALTTVSCSYLVARYSAFTKEFPEYQLYVVEFGLTSSVYQWQPDESVVPYHRVILSEEPAEQQSELQLFFLLNTALQSIQPDVLIICGYGVSGMLSALAWSKLHQKPTVLLSESKADDLPRLWWKEIIKGFLVKQYNSALVGGKAHQEYLIRLGVDPQAIFTGYDVVGNDTFHPNNIKGLVRPISKSYFLAVNRFIPKKNLLLLIAAYAEYRNLANQNSWDLVLCGDGITKKEILGQIDRLELQEYVHLPGFLQPKALLPYFAHASCFIHVSIQEQWGLVVNEAMAAGLPTIVSNRCGCFQDLVIEGVNGFGFDPTNQAQLTELMLKVSATDFDLALMGDTALKHIQKFSPSYFAKNLKKAIDYAVTHFYLK